MKQINKKISLGFLVAIAVFALPVVLATTTINVPVANGNYTTTLNLNVTTDLSNTLNVTCYYDSIGGVVNSSDSQLTAVVNTSAGQTEFTDAVDISALTDTATYNITCIADNGSATEEATNIAGITFDSTDPTVSLSVLKSTISYGNVVEYKCTSTDGIDASPTEAISVAHPSGDSPSSTTLTAGTSDFVAFTDTDYPGTYTITCTSTDYAGNVATSTSTITAGELGNLIVKNDVGEENDQTKVLIIIALGALAIYFATRK